VTFTAKVTSQGTGTPTGEVIFTDGGSVFLGAVLLTNGSATISTPSLAAGPHSIVASYTGDSNFAFSASQPLSQVVKTSTTLAVGSSLNPSVYGQTIALSATVTPQNGGAPTGTVTFYDGTAVLGTANVSGNTACLFGVILAAGSNSIVASYSGDNNFLSSASAPLIQIVSQATTTLFLTSSANPIAENQTVTYTATITSQAGGAPTGTVLFRDRTTITTVGVAGGIARLTEAYSTLGNQVITASYSGDFNNAGSTSGSLAESVEDLPVATKTVVNSSGSPSPVDQTVTFTATITSSYGSIPNGETVSFYDGAVLLGATTTAGGLATISAAGLSARTHTITATYAGDATSKRVQGRWNRSSLYTPAQPHSRSI
jgi:hypothetical protein